MLAAPTFEDDDKSRLAGILNTVLLVMLAAVIAYGLFTPVSAAILGGRVIILGLTAALLMGLLYSLRRGHVQLVAAALVAALWMLLTAVSFFNDGVRGGSFNGYMLVILSAGLLIGQRATLVTTAASIAAGGLMVYADGLGLVSRPAGPPDPFSFWVAQSAYFAVAAVLLTLANFTIADALRRARREVAERGQAEAREHALTRNLRAVVEAADELIRLDDLDTLYRRAVELAREKLNVERCGLFVLDDAREFLLGTYGTDLEGRTADERAVKLPASVHPELFAPRAGPWIFREREQTYWDGEQMRTASTGWIVMTIIRGGDQPLGTFSNDTAITHAPLDEAQQESLALYCSLLGNIIERKRAEAALARERDLLQALMTSIPDTIYFKDTASRFTRINPAQAELLGVSPDEAIGKTDLDFQRPDLAQAFLEEERQLIATGQAVIDRLEYNPTRAGQPRWLSATKVPLRDAAGRVLGLVGVSRDVTARVEAEERERAITRGLRGVMEAADELIRCEDLDTLHRRAVELAREKLGLERCGLFLLSPSGDTLLGTFGTDDQGRTTDERAVRLPTHRHPDVFAPSEPRWLMTSRELAYWEGDRHHVFGAGWVATTVIRNLGQPIGILRNDSGLTGAPVNEAQQESLVVYCSLLGNIIERKRAEQRDKTLTRNLRAVVEAADELIACPDLDTFYRRAVELAREKLNVERCALFMLDEAREFLVGTYGTDLEGRTADERAVKLPASVHPELFIPSAKPWASHEREQTYWDGERIRTAGAGWVAMTVIRIGSESIGTFSNDTAITHAPLDEAQQESLALYCSLLGNILKRKRAEEAVRESEERYRFVTEGLAHFIWVARPDGEVEYVNSHWTHYTGLPREAGLGSGWEAVQHADDDAHTSAVWTAAAASETRAEMEHRLRRGADGQYRWHRSTIQPIRDAEGRVRWIGLTVDIHDQKEAAAQILQMNETLEERVRERTAQLEEANREMEAFSYTVSHDLRAPLRAINSFASLLKEDYAAQLPPEAHRYLDRVRRGALQMATLIDDLLAFSRLNRQSLNTRAVLPEALAREVLEGLHLEYAERRVEFVIGALPECRADATLLKQVYANLLTNALKFTRRREVARIEVGWQAGAYFVRDNGVGFDPRFADKLFGVFQRLHRAEDYEGTGVGLAIVHRIVQRHGGRVWAEAELERGATFYFTLEGGA